MSVELLTGLPSYVGFCKYSPAVISGIGFEESTTVSVFDLDQHHYDFLLPDVCGQSRFRTRSIKRPSSSRQPGSRSVC
jgi:hypothetical protein